MALFSLTCIFKLGWIQNIFFYSIWTYVGLFYSDIIIWLNNRRFSYLLWLIASVGTVTIIILYIAGYPIDMQYNKFPPTLLFLIFSITMMSLIISTIPQINHVYECICRTDLIKKVFDLFSSRSLTIFLYQVFAFSISIRLVYDFFPGDTAILGIIKSVICFLITVPICALLSLVFGKIEKVAVSSH